MSRLWDELGKALPEDCRWIAWGTPALVHPRTGIIFGFCSGTHAYGLRLPPLRVNEAISKGAVRQLRYPALPKLQIPERILNVETFGPGWILGRWIKEEEFWCGEAYDEAAG